MNIVVAIILLVVGLVVLWKSADLLVAGAVSLAERLGISSLVLGLTVVAMGTSAPELATSVVGVVGRADGGDIAVGNVFGSNIANLALIGGLVALIRPLEVRKRTLFREIPAMLAVALLLWPFLHDSYMARWEGLILLAVFAALIIFVVHTAKQEARQTLIEAKNVVREMNRQPSHTIKNVLFVVIGLVGLALGAEMVVDGAVFIGERIGLSQAVIAITIIAFGTSLPELVTCVVAALKGHHDISVGNLVGSNIFNTLLVTGAAAVVRPFKIESPQLAGGTDYWIMVGASGAFAAAVLIGRCVVGRTSGVLLVCAYIGYVLYLLFV
jgi:cation:H+ antiporter